MKLAWKAALASVALAAIGIAATPASAALTLGSTNCALTDIGGLSASACRGWYQGNLNNGSPTDLANQAAALNSLLGVSTYTQANISWLDSLGSLSGNTANFAPGLFGQTVVSFHVGGANGAKKKNDLGGVGYNGTAFYIFDAGNFVGGLDAITFNRSGLSNARLYFTGQFIEQPPAVPEPATWLMMIAGFGLIGGAMRRRKPVAALA